MPEPQPRRIRAAIREEPIAELAKQAEIGVAFRVENTITIRPSPGGRGVALLLEQPVREPWVKDYDAIPGNAPADWLGRFDTSRWVLFGAYARGERVGGVVVAPPLGDDGLPHEPGVAILWDLRVAASRRGQGVGAQLFKAAESWARARGWSLLEAETQNVNVAACRFYQRMGCRLHSHEAGAYPDLPDEIRVVWRKGG